MAINTVDKVLKNYRFCFEVCAKVDDVINAFLSKIKDSVKDVKNNIWTEETAKTILRMVKIFFENGLKAFLLLSKVESLLMDLSRKKKPSGDIQKLLDSFYRMHGDAYQSFVNKFIKRAQSNKAPFDSFKITKAKYPFMYFQSIALKKNLKDYEDIQIDHTYINSEIDNNIDSPSGLIFTFGAWFASVGFNPDGTNPVNEVILPAMKKKVAQDHKSKEQSASIVKESAPERGDVTPLVAPKNLYGYINIVKEVEEINNNTKDGFIRLHFNCLGKYDKNSISCNHLEDIRLILELLKFEDIEHLLEKLLAIQRFSIFFGVKKIQDEGNPYKVVKGDGYCAYRAAAVIRSLQEQEDAPDNARKDLDLSEPNDFEVFSKCVNYIKDQTNLTVEKAKEDILSIALPCKDDPSYSKIKAQRVFAEDEVTRGEQLLFKITQVLSIIEQYRKELLLATTDTNKPPPKFPDLDEAFWPDSEVFTLSRFKNSIVIYEEYLDFNEKKNNNNLLLWIRPVVQIGGYLDNKRGQNSATEQFKYDLSFEQITEIIQSHHNTVRIDENHFNLYFRSRQRMESNFLTIVSAYESFATTFFSKRKQLHELCSTFLKQFEVACVAHFNPFYEFNIAPYVPEYAMTLNLQEWYFPETTRTPPRINEIAFADAKAKFNRTDDPLLLFTFPPENIVVSSHNILNNPYAVAYFMLHGDQ